MFSRSTKAQVAPVNEISNVSWEADIVLLQRRSLQTAWRLLTFAGLLILMLSAAIIAMLPLKSTVPYVFTVDKLTGEVAVASTAKDFVKSSELNDKYWVKQFLLAHERYSYRLLQNDYDQVHLLAGDTVYRLYAERFDGPNALDKKLAENVQIIPTILSVSISNGNLATVRFERKQQDVRPGGDTKTTRWLALIKFEYKVQIGRKEGDLISNPLGFVVTSYQVDPELDAGGTK